MMKPGGFLKKVFNPGNVVGKVGKALGSTAKVAHKATMGSIKAPAKAAGSVFGMGGGKSKGPSKGGFGGLLAKAKEAKAAKQPKAAPSDAMS